MYVKNPGLTPATLLASSRLGPARAPLRPRRVKKTRMEGRASRGRSSSRSPSPSIHVCGWDSWCSHHPPPPPPPPPTTTTKQTIVLNKRVKGSARCQSPRTTRARPRQPTCVLCAVSRGRQQVTDAAPHALPAQVLTLRPAPHKYKVAAWPLCISTTDGEWQ